MATLAARDGHVPVVDLEESLGDVAIGGFDAFGLQVQLVYRALALDTRTRIVAMTETTVGRPEETVEHFHAAGRRRWVGPATSLRSARGLQSTGFARCAAGFVRSF